MRIEANNAIALAIILAICFIYSKDRSSNTLIMLAVILGVLVFLYRDKHQELVADEQGYYKILGQTVKLGSYGSRN